MRRLFYILLFIAFSPASIGAESTASVGMTTIRNGELGFSFTVPGTWSNRSEKPLIFEGQEFKAAYWEKGMLGDSLPFVLVRNVETGKVDRADMIGLNKIAVQSSMNGINADLKPLLAVQNFYPYKSLFSYSIEQGGDPEDRVLVNKYVYYTEKGMLEFSMHCGFKDTETMVTTNIALKNVTLDKGVAYEALESDGDALVGEMGTAPMVILGIVSVLVIFGGARFLRSRG